MILSPIEKQIKEKIERVGTPLKDWDVNIYRGVLTGYNEAFIIDGDKKNELVAEDPNSIKIIKPIDEAFFLGGLSKDKVLQAFKAHIFFDDQDAHLKDASVLVPSGRVPYHSTSPLYVNKPSVSDLNLGTLKLREIAKLD